MVRDDWGFQGAVITDWGAVSDRVKGINAGVDLEMPGSKYVASRQNRFHTCPRF